jgi:hypothetical protein
MGIPTNVVDAASAFKDGLLGVIETVQIGDVIVSALTGLQWPMEREVTRRPVQAGFSVAMGANIVPSDIVMDVVLANPNFAPEALATAALTGNLAGFTATWREKKAQLEQYFADGETLDGTTHLAPFSGYIISRIEPRFDAEENWDCWIASVTLTPFDNRQADADAGVAGAMTAALQSVGGM